MQVEIGSKWVKDGEVVEVVYCGEVLLLNAKVMTTVGKVVIFVSINKNTSSILTENNFLEQYKLYDPVYEYQYAIQLSNGEIRITEGFSTDEEVDDALWIIRQRLDFTKRERVCK